MAEPNHFDLVVIGGGPAGYVGAIRAAQLGMTTACVEKEKLGGICLNWGCIPTKALLAGAEFYARLKHEAADWGILADNVRHDWTRIIGRSRTVSDGLNRGIGGLFKKNKVTHIPGTARILAAGKVQVTAADGKLQTLTCKNILVATGAGPRPFPGTPFDGDKVISYREAMVLPAQPGSILVIGAGPIGLEFAYFFNAYGTKATVVEMMPRVLPNEDHDVSKAVEKSFRRQGIEVLTATQTRSVKVTPDGVEITVSPVNDEKATQTLRGDKLIVAIGVAGKFENLFDDSLKPEVERGHLKVNKATYQTNLPGIYAVGDVIGPPWLAHVASEEAIVCVERIAGHHVTDIDYSSIPGCTYCLPQVASLGLTEQACIDKGMKLGSDYKVGKFPFQASGKAQALGATEGFIKIISDAKHGEILGVHMVGEHVTELLAEMGLAKRLEATTDELIATMHAHPTLSEGVHEAALGVEGRMIHF